jgi:hypothetical protein
MKRLICALSGGNIARFFSCNTALRNPFWTDVLNNRWKALSNKRRRGTILTNL